MAAAEVSGRELAATWRRQDDQVVATTFGGTMCWNPVLPGTLRAHSDGYWHIIPCRDCPGCRERERRILGDRLVKKYGDGRCSTSDSSSSRGRRSASGVGAAMTSVAASAAGGCVPSTSGKNSAAARPKPSLTTSHKKYRDNSKQTGRRHALVGAHRVAGDAGAHPKQEDRLFLVRIWAPRELHASFSHALHRRPRLKLEPGFVRLGTECFAVLAREVPPIREALKAMGRQFRTEPIRLSRGRRAWRSVTAGMTVSREQYGEDLNRFYIHGLPPAERKRWEVIKLPAKARYDRRSSPRAWTIDNLVLVPPELWKLGRGNRKSIMRQLASEHSPEGIARVMALVRSAGANLGRQLPVTAPPEAALIRERQLAFYQRQAERAAAARTEESGVRSDPPSSEKGGYESSGHSSGSGPPVDKWLASDREHKQRLLERDKAWADDWAKRMAEKAKERGRG